MVRHLTIHQHAVGYAVAEVLDLAETWLGCDGRPIYRDSNAWTPPKALRRVVDHLLDHLAEIECGWQASRRCPTTGTAGW